LLKPREELPDVDAPKGSILSTVVNERAWESR